MLHHKKKKLAVCTLITSLICTKMHAISNEDWKYQWDETQARTEINQEIRNKFGAVSAAWWPFLSDEEKNKRRMKNQEIDSIQALAIREIDTPDNYKRIDQKKKFTRYETKVVRKPIQKTITVWEDVTETVPVTDFRDTKEKRWSERRLRERVGSAIVKFIGDKSYSYALRKTGNPVIADIIKKDITSEVTRRVSSRYMTLSDFIGKSREFKINEKIRKIQKQEESRLKELSYHSEGDTKKITPSAPSFEPKQPSAPTMKKYPSQACCICFAKLTASNRVFLDPCGHDICSGCFKSYNKKCALCRTDVKQGFPESSSGFSARS